MSTKKNMNTNNIENDLDYFPIGLIIIEKENENQFRIKMVNSYARKLLDLPQNLDINLFKERLEDYKIWENNQIKEEVNLSKILFEEKHLINFNVGTFVSSISMINVKIKTLKNTIYMCIDNYSDERKNIKDNLIKSLKYQYIVTLYHELNNPLNALENIIDENNNECNQFNKDFPLENKIKNNEINLLVHLIKIFIKNFIWYFRLIFELSNHTKVPLNSKINLEYQFNKMFNQYDILFKYKEIKYTKNFSVLNDKYIESNEQYLNNFLRSVVLLLYNKVPKKTGFEIKYLLKENKLKLIFERREASPNRRNKNKIINDIDFKFKQEFDFSKTIQTEEMTKELLMKMSKIMKIKIKIYDEDDNKFLSLLIPYTIENEEIEIVDEFTPQQKLNNLYAVNRNISLNISENQIKFEFNNSYIKKEKENSLNINYSPILYSPVPSYNIKVIDFDENKSKYENIDNNSFLNDSFIKDSKFKSLFFKKLTVNNTVNNDSIISSISDISNIKSIKSKKLQDEFNSLNGEIYNKQTTNYLGIDKQNKRSIFCNNDIIDDNLIIDNSILSNKRGSNKSTSRGRKSLNESKDERLTTSISNNEKKNNCNCKNILLCDDETFNLNTIKNMLKKFKIECDLSSNGQECIDAILNKKKISCNCDKKDYKLIFLDMMMPVMNGLEAAKKIQEMIDNKEINDDLKIIIVSAHIEENLLNELKNIKCICDEVNKPLKKCKLEELLNTFYF